MEDKDRLRNMYTEKMPEDELIDMAMQDPAEYEEGVYDLVMELTIRIADGVKEPKSGYLMRVMQSGSHKAKILKLADRISNLFSLGFVHDDAFVAHYLAETKEFILPYAERVNEDMFRERVKIFCSDIDEEALALLGALGLLDGEDHLGRQLDVDGLVLPEDDGVGLALLEEVALLLLAGDADRELLVVRRVHEVVVLLFFFSLLFLLPFDDEVTVT
jgi:hypothetical protein